MTDQTCAECERLWHEYDLAAQAKRIIEHRSVTETGLEVLMRKASNRCQQARSALLDHMEIHMPVTATASVNRLEFSTATALSKLRLP
jgi:hypothetical protein